MYSIKTSRTVIINKAVFLTYLHAGLVETGQNNVKESCVTLFIRKIYQLPYGLILQHSSKLYTKFCCFTTARIWVFAFQRAGNSIILLYCLRNIDSVIEHVACLTARTDEQPSRCELQRLPDPFVQIYSALFGSCLIFVVSFIR